MRSFDHPCDVIFTLVLGWESSELVDAMGTEEKGAGIKSLDIGLTCSLFIDLLGLIKVLRNS